LPPPLIVEILSPSNRPAEMNRQRLVAMSGGTREFWIVDPDNRAVLVTDLTATILYGASQTIPGTPWHGAIAVDDSFAV
jgi:Uma2 family endonuclease